MRADSCTMAECFARALAGLSHRQELRVSARSVRGVAAVVQERTVGPAFGRLGLASPAGRGAVHGPGGRASLGTSGSWQT